MCSINLTSIDFENREIPEMFYPENYISGIFLFFIGHYLGSKFAGTDLIVP